MERLQAIWESLAPVRHAAVRAWYGTVRAVWLAAAWGWHASVFVSYCFFVVGSFFLEWAKTRPGRQLALGLPAVIAAGAVVWTMAAAASFQHHRAARSYLQAAFDASRQGQWKAADLYLEKLRQFQHAQDPEVTFHLALIAQHRGDLQRARTLMAKIAPADGRGYGRAHLWLASDLARNFSPLDPREQQLLEHHLLSALAAGVPDVQAHVMLAELYLKQRRLADAVPHLVAASDRLPSVLITLAKTYSALGQKDEAKRTAVRALTYFQRLADDEPDNPAHQLMLARLQLFLDRPEEAERLLLEGLQQLTARREEQAQRAGLRARARSELRPNDGRTDSADLEKLQAQFYQTLADAYVLQYDHATRQDPEDLATRLELLEQALRFAPNNAAALQRLAQFAVYRRRTPEGRAALARLKDVLAAGRAPASVHLALGTSLLERGANDEAIQHLELAFEHMPQMPAVANNLAWALAFSEKPDLQRAEKLIDVAVRLAPDHPEIRETRGLILAKAGKTKQAIADLELALKAFPQRARIHEELARLYDQLGDKELAAKHRRLAERLLQAQSP